MTTLPAMPLGFSLGEPLPASFRDPSGFVFRKEGLIYRQISPSYLGEYRRLMDSGLYARLVEAELLLPHEEVEENILLPEQLMLVSYPYEWSFGQWKDAALATLALQRQALDFGMWLKDASVFNIQYHHGKPMLIDTLSFESYPAGSPWIAYRQFCEHFLAPLALMAYTDIRLGRLLRTYLDGIPLTLATKLLPWRSRLNVSLLAHLHVQARIQEKASNARVTTDSREERVSEAGLRALLENLEDVVRGLNWEPDGTVWGDYYEDTNYTKIAMLAKEQFVASFFDEIAPLKSVWDFGANDARFSRLASERGIDTVAFDVDPAAVEKAYRDVRKRHETRLLPLLLDLTNPSPDLGWAHQERMSLLARGPADCVMALALVHHLAIGNNVPLERISEFFADASQRWLIVEFVPKEDSQTQRLLSYRPDIFPDYHRDGFEVAFAPRWEIVRREEIAETKRTLYLMRRRQE